MAFPAFNSAGTPTPNRVVFNSGYIDFGNTRLVNVDNIKIDYKYTSVPMYVLNSIKIANLARSQEAVTITGVVKTFSPEMEGLMFGSSTSSGGNIGYIALDGQPSLLNPNLTVYDQNNNEYQYQITGALFTTDTVTFTNEQFSSWDFTLTCIDINLVKVSGV
jgi:hypothetical protein